jgi:TonB family protein
MQAVEQLYSSAAYEDALAALDTLEVDGDEDRLESAEYRILCLLGLGEIERAEAAIETLVIQHPNYSPNPARFSPSRRQQFDAVRRAVLNRVIEVSAAEARASFEARDYDAAILRFDALLQLVTVFGSEEQFASVRIYAADFAQQAKLAASALADESKPKPPGLQAVALHGNGNERVASTAGSAPIYDVSSTDVVPPVALKPILPPTSPDGVTPHPGLFEILIDETGRVRSASVRRSVTAQYDALVLRESAKWRFKPALRNGQPVSFRKLVEIYAAPLASLQR